jgi:hypothetical protein
VNDESVQLKPWRVSGLRATNLRAKRRAWIERFEAQQRERRQYCKLAWAVDEMARRLTSNGETLLDRDPRRLKRALRDIQRAIGESAFGDQLLNICETERLRRLTEGEARAIGSMEPAHFNGWPKSSSVALGSRPVVEDLWTTRERLEALFVKKGWRAPDWLAGGDSCGSNPLAKTASGNTAKNVIQAVRPGRKPGQGSYAEIDLPLLDEMERLLQQRKAASAEEAAKKVAEKAHGTATLESKVDRLAKRFRERHRSR